MSDEMDVLFDHRLRSALHAAELPPAPATLRDVLDALPRAARAPRRSLPRRVAWGALAAGIAIVAFVAWGAIFGQGGIGPGGEATPTPSTSPSPSPSITPEPASSTYPAYTIGDLLDRRADGSIRSESIITFGYYSDLRRSPLPCPSVSSAALELGCFDRRQGITPEEVSVGAIVEGAWVPTSARVLHPFWPPSLADNPRADAFWAAVDRLAGSPVFVMLTGHFDDALAAECPKDASPPCADRFVVDDVLSFDDSSATASPSPNGTPFPSGSPPPPPSWFANCTKPRDPDSAEPGDPLDPPLASEGWVHKADLPFDFPVSGQVPEMVYFGIVEGAVPLGVWIEAPEGSGERYRWWGTSTCVATSDWISYGWLPGTTYRVYEDGHRVDGGDPFDPLPTATPAP